MLLVLPSNLAYAAAPRAVLCLSCPEPKLGLHHLRAVLLLQWMLEIASPSLWRVCRGEQVNKPGSSTSISNVWQLCLPHLQAIICKYLWKCLAGGRWNAQRWGIFFCHEEDILAATSVNIDMPLDKIQALGTAWGPGTGYSLNSYCAQSHSYVLIQSSHCRAPFRYKELILLQS